MHAEQKYIDRVRSYLEERYAENVTLDDLARFVNLSPYHLLRLFRQQTGLPPHTYLTQVRVRRARSLLRAGVPIAETALQVGFTDQSHLSRHFKRTVGVPPGQYARASKIVQDG
jgi:AraC-like DNA-binding protein